MRNISAAKKGLVTGFVMIGLSLLFYYGLKFPVMGKDQYVIYAVYLAGITWSLLSFKQISGEGKKFKDYFSTGFKTFVVVTLLMVIYTFIFFKFNTGYMEAGISENNAILLKEGNHTPAEIESNAKQLRGIFIPLMLGIATFKYLILGALVTAIGSGFCIRKAQ